MNAGIKFIFEGSYYLGVKIKSIVGGRYYNGIPSKNNNSFKEINWIVL